MLIQRNYDPFFELFAPRAYAEHKKRSEHPRAFRAHVDITENEDAYVLSAEVPGFKREQLDIEVEGESLTLRGERSDDKSEKKVHVNERRQGKFTRRFTFNHHIDNEAVSAELKDGVLTVTLPKAAEDKTKKIEIV